MQLSSCQTLFVGLSWLSVVRCAPPNNPASTVTVYICTSSSSLQVPPNYPTSASSLQVPPNNSTSTPCTSSSFLQVPPYHPTSTSTPCTSSSSLQVPPNHPTSTPCTSSPPSNPVGTFISDICTSPLQHFNTLELSLGKEYCSLFLNISPSTQTGKSIAAAPSCAGDLTFVSPSILDANYICDCPDNYYRYCDHLERIHSTIRCYKLFYSDADTSADYRYNNSSSVSNRLQNIFYVSKHMIVP